MGQAKVTGPDLSAGIALSEVADGAMVAGHVGEEGVLLARRGDELFAVGSNCTHYGGPLAEGLLVGDEVRCPWHHACFSLRTGEALRAPALNPIPRWRVEREDGKVFVREKIAPAPRPRAGRGGPSSVVIVGAGASGTAAAEMLRRKGYENPITLVGMEEGTPVDRPNLSKDYLAGTAPEAWVRLWDEGFFRDARIDLVRAEAVSVDPGKKEVLLADGRRLPYGALLLATGATPIHLPLPGGDAPHVHYLRSIDDSRRIIAAAQNAKAAVVVGGSFIGLEVAASLRTRGVPVDLVAWESRPLEKVLGPDLSRVVQRLHEEHGVRFHLGRAPTSIQGDSVTLDDGSRLRADLVVLGVGVRPLTKLAETAGCKVDGGVVVDGTLQTSVPDIYAAGDIARWPDARTGTHIRVEHWVVAERLGQHAARSILGEKKLFRDVPFFWSRHYEVPIGYVGHATRWDRAELSGSAENQDCAVAFREGDRIAAVAALHRDRDSLEAELAMERDDAQALEALFTRR